MIDDISTRYNVDPKRIFIVGHSNGAFMSHRLACDLSDRIAAIASLAGAAWNDASKCNPSSQVSVLDVHGDADTVINYGGGAVPADLIARDPPETQPPYPSEAETMAHVGTPKIDVPAILTPNVLTSPYDPMPRPRPWEPTGRDGVRVRMPAARPASMSSSGRFTVGRTFPASRLRRGHESIYAFLKAHPKP